MLRKSLVMTGLLVLAACDHAEMAQTRGPEFIREGTYLYDSATELCYLSGPGPSGYTPWLITNVPCTDKVRRIAIDARGKPGRIT